MANLINLEPYVNSEGKITQFPHKQGAKQAVLVYLAQRFETNRFYSEKEINAICDANADAKLYPVIEVRPCRKAAEPLSQFLK